MCPPSSCESSTRWVPCVFPSSRECSCDASGCTLLRQFASCVDSPTTELYQERAAAPVWSGGGVKRLDLASERACELGQHDVAEYGAALARVRALAVNDEQVTDVSVFRSLHRIDECTSRVGGTEPVQVDRVMHGCRASTEVVGTSCRNPECISNDELVVFFDLKFARSRTFPHHHAIPRCCGRCATCGALGERLHVTNEFVEALLRGFVARHERQNASRCIECNRFAADAGADRWPPPDQPKDFTWILGGANEVPSATELSLGW